MRHVSRLSAAASEFGAALAESFVERSGLIFLALAVLCGLVAVVWVESGSTPLPPDSGPVDVEAINPLHVALFLVLYGLAGLVFGVFVWVGIPMLVVSGIVWLRKIALR
jgi:hypothetical protein